MLYKLKTVLIALLHRLAIFAFAAYGIPTIIKAACSGMLQIFHLADKLALLF